MSALSVPSSWDEDGETTQAKVGRAEGRGRAWEGGSLTSARMCPLDQESDARLIEDKCMAERLNQLYWAVIRIPEQRVYNAFGALRD